jgi:hypothetical protein
MVGSGIFVAHPLKVALVALVSALAVAAVLRRPRSREELEAGAAPSERPPA